MFRCIMTFPAPAATFCLLIGPILSPAAESGVWDERIGSLVREGRLHEATRMAQAAASEPGAAPSAYSWLGRISMAGARFEEASDHFGRARDLGASVAEIADPWSRALVRTGRRIEACAVLGEAAASEPRDATLRYLAGACYLRIGAHWEALPHLEAAYGAGVAHSAAALELAEARMDCGREDLAVEQLAEITDRSSDPGTLLAVGKMLFRNVLYRQALDPLAKAWEIRPGWYDAGMYLALARYQLEDYRNSAEVLGRLQAEPRPREARLLLGSALARLGEDVAAREEFDAAIRTSPGRADGHLNLGLFLLDHGHRDEALEAFAHAAAGDAAGAKIFYSVKTRPNCRDLKPPARSAKGDPGQAQFLAAFGDRLLAGQQWGAALEVYLTALSIDPRLPGPLGGVGLVCQELGTAGVGLEFVKRGLELHPSDRELRYFLGSLYEHLSQPEKAIQSYRIALGLGDPSTVPARYWLRLGLVQLAIGMESEAEKSFTTALDRDPEFPEGLYHLGKLRFREGQYAEAEKLLERAVRLDPSMDGAYYSWGLACVRNGNGEKGRTILESHRRKAALRQSQVGGMQ